MTIAALITEGIGPGGSVLYIMTGGLAIGATPPVVNPWTPATIDTQSWSAATPASDIWTPATNDTQSWTPQ